MRRMERRARTSGMNAIDVREMMREMMEAQREFHINTDASALEDEMFDHWHEMMGFRRRYLNGEGG